VSLLQLLLPLLAVQVADGVRLAGYGRRSRPCHKFLGEFQFLDGRCLNVSLDDLLKIYRRVAGPFEHGGINGWLVRWLEAR
jgi:hypothetical protein